LDILDSKDFKEGILDISFFQQPEKCICHFFLGIKRCIKSGKLHMNKPLCKNLQNIHSPKGLLGTPY